jgi:hypothetical protein
MQANLQRLQDPSDINGANLHNVMRDISRRFRNVGINVWKKIKKLEKVLRTGILESFVKA